MKFTKVIALILCVCMMATVLAGCGAKTEAPAATEAPAEAPAEAPVLAADAQPAEIDLAAYEAASYELYDEVLGEFMAIYEQAKAADNRSMRYALMAQAEAKLMESAVMLPTSTNGGMYAISRVAPYTVNSTLWGNDSYRYHQAVIATEPISAAHRDEMKAKWNEIRGTGEYEAWAKEFLTTNGYELKNSYSLGYTSDPETWDVLATSRAADSEAIINTYDGLYEYDIENVQQPALALSHEVSADGLVYTFHLREDAIWTDSQGGKVADVVADDFVAGMQHMMDAMGGLEYLVEGIIVNATEYIYDEISDFSQVGVKAIDEHTVEYTLTAPCDYFTTMLGYSIFAPMSRSYYESMGGKFGADFDSSAESYTYGKDPNSIAYCGPYLVTNNTAKNTIVFQASESYWNAGNINLDTITWLFNDGTDATKAYNDMKAGTIDGCSLNTSALEVAKADGLFDELAYVSLTDATSFMGFLNINRSIFKNINDETTVVSEQTVTDAERTKAAMQNVHFRRAFCMSVDRGAYNAQVVGEELKYNSLRNSYTPATFVTLPEEVTIDINGTATTFPAGTNYGEIMQAQIDADGVQLKVYDADLANGDGFDGWFNAEAAVAELNLAIEELAAAGIEISAENPIYVDLPTPMNSETYVNQKNALKQSVESALGGKVIVNLTNCVDYQQWYYCGYYTDYGYQANYDMYDLSGWGPDYGDPQTYLDTFLGDYAGYMIKCIGIF